jgi:hypothetical protein
MPEHSSVDAQVAILRRLVLPLQKCSQRRVARQEVRVRIDR